MSSKYTYYCIKSERTVEVGEEPTKITVVFVTYSCIKLSEVYYEMDPVREALGLIKKTEADKVSPPAVINILRRRNEASRQGLIGEMNMTIRLVDGSTEFRDWGTEHKTTLVYNLAVPPKEVASALLSVEWNFNNGKSKYKVVPGSITEKKTKGTTPKYG